MDPVLDLCVRKPPSWTTLQVPVPFELAAIDAIISLSIEQLEQGPLLDVCVRGPIMDPVLDVCVREPIIATVLVICVSEPIMDPVLDVCVRESIMVPLLDVCESIAYGPSP